MNPVYILAVSLFVIPLCGPVIIEPIIAVYDLWTTKEFLVLMTVILAALASFARGANHHVKINYPLFALMLFLPISVYSAPPLKLIYGHENIAGMWLWRGMAWVFIYLILYFVVCANPIVQDRQRKFLISCLGWAAIVSAVYAYIQFAGLDQWQLARSWKELIGNSEPGDNTIKSVNITAVIGNPTYLATYLVMCLPFLILFFRWYWTVLVMGAIILCQSDIGIAGIAMVLISMACLRARSTIWLKIVVGCALTILVLIWANWSEIRPKIHDNGRFGVWAQTVDDWRSPCIKLPITKDMSEAQKIEIEKMNKRTYSLTGRGIGSFPFIFSPKYGTRYDSAHNEYLEGLYSIGLIGQVLFLAAVGFVLFFSFWIARGDAFTMAVYVSFLFCCFSAFGLSTLHIEPLRFFSAMMFCILSSRIPRRENIVG